LRSWQFIQGLRERGFEVVASMPLFTHLSKINLEHIPAEVKRFAWTFENQDELVEEVRPDVVVFMNAETYALRRHRLPTVFDLAGPRLLEAQYLRVPDQMSRIARKIENLRVPDLVTCAGPSQRFYFLGFLLQTGIAVQDLRIEVVPFSLSSSVPKRVDRGGDPIFVFGGGFFPWQDATSALAQVAGHLERRGKGILHIYGESHDVNGRDRRRFEELKASLCRNSRVRFLGYVAHDELVRRYCESAVALDLMGRNFERELAFTTRTVVYLWCGLPVIYNDYSDLSRYIERYRAGWCLDPTDRKRLEEVVDEILDEPGRVKEYAANAQRLVAEELDWAKTIQPVAEFCAEPRIRPKRYYEFAYLPGVDSSSDARALAQRLAEIEGTLGWRALVRMRSWVHTLCPPSTRRGRLVSLVLLGVRTALRVGVWQAVRKAMARPNRIARLLGEPARLTLDEQYRRWLAWHRLTAEQRAAMEREAAVWRYRPVISIVVPVYNTAERWLRACVESVRRQVYPYWELCIADHSCPN